MSFKIDPNRNSSDSTSGRNTQSSNREIKNVTKAYNAEQTVPYSAKTNLLSIKKITPHLGANIKITNNNNILSLEERITALDNNLQIIQLMSLPLNLNKNNFTLDDVRAFTLKFAKSNNTTALPSAEEIIRRARQLAANAKIPHNDNNRLSSTGKETFAFAGKFNANSKTNSALSSTDKVIKLAAKFFG